MGVLTGYERAKKERGGFKSRSLSEAVNGKGKGRGKKYNFHGQEIQTVWSQMTPNKFVSKVELDFHHSSE